MQNHLQSLSTLLSRPLKLLALSSKACLTAAGTLTALLWLAGAPALAAGPDDTARAPHAGHDHGAASSENAAAPSAHIHSAQNHAGHAATHDHAGQPPAQTAPGKLDDPLANRFGGKFSLIDHQGNRVSDETYRGRYMLIYFGYTKCVDLCPVDLAIMAQALQMAKPELAAKIQPLFISVDPEFDTPAELAKFVPAIDPRIIGLTGTVAEIEVAARAYRVKRHELLHIASNGHPHIIDHGSLMYLMGPDGKFVTFFPHNTPPEKIAENLDRYVK